MSLQDGLKQMLRNKGFYELVLSSGILSQGEFYFLSIDSFMWVGVLGVVVVAVLVVWWQNFLFWLYFDCILIPLLRKGKVNVQEQNCLLSFPSIHDRFEQNEWLFSSKRETQLMLTIVIIKW